MKKITILYTIVLTCLAVSAANAQMLSNQGALISVKSNAFVSVHGNTLNDKGGTFDNSNEIYCYGDWQNDANNTAFVSRGEGVVYLTGDNQIIKGTSITQFYDLQLQATGTKYAEIDVHVDGELQLNDREFSVDTHTVHVFNTALNAVEHNQNSSGTWGMISALGNGGLARNTANTTNYFYPMGSNVGTPRFRPIMISPTSTANNTYKVRLANVDATVEGWDRSLKAFEVCEVNPVYYHRISHLQGNDAANIGIFYDPVQEGNYEAIGKWGVANLWQKTSDLTNLPNATYGLAVGVSSAISDFSPNAFALIETAAKPELVATPNPICSNDELTLTASNTGSNFSNYDFYVDSMLVQSSTNDTYQSSTIRTGDVPIWVVGSTTECGSQSDTILLEVWQGVDAQAFSDTIIVAGTAANLIATGGDFYTWLNNVALGCDICAATTASPLQSTRYEVEVESLDGCTDTASVLVEVREAVADIIFIPNVLTPNQDGANDTWFIKNIQLFPKNSVKIINRWGDVVFSANSYQNDWEGTFSGQLLPAGTYYYILDAGGSFGVLKGDVTILRE